MLSRPVSIYAENRVGISSAFAMTEEAIRQAWPGKSSDLSIAVHSADAPDFDALRNAQCFVGSGFDPRRVVSGARELQLIHCNSAGVDSYLPLDWLPNSVHLTNSSGVNSQKGGTFGAMAILMLNEKIPFHMTNQHRRIWHSSPSTGISGKTVVIVGLGSLGQAIASSIKPFGARIIGVSLSGNANAVADATYTPSHLAEVLPQADFLVLACPLTAQTRGLIGRSELALLPDHAGVINMARARVLDNHALVQCLEAGSLSGAILDVFDPEPLPSTSSLWDISNLIITPHISCDDPSTYINSCLSIFTDNIQRLLDGKPLRNVVDSRRGY